MDLRLLANFCAVAEQENLTRAARRVRLSQPALSVQMRTLEKTVGVPLLRKAGRNIELTDAGRVFAKEAQAILQRAERAAEEARRVGRAGRVTLRVGYVPTIEYTVLPHLMPLLPTVLPGVRPSFRIMRTAEMADALRAGETDVCFLRLPADLRGLKHKQISTEGYVVMLPSRHALASRKEIEVSTLSGIPYIFFERSVQPSLYDTVLNLFHDNDAELNVACEADNILSVSNLVASGGGISVHREYVAQMRWPGIRYRPLLPTPPRSKIAIAYQEARASDATLKFVHAVLDVVAATKPSAS
jgi:DNA-binding transcriptional LysR family regulator